MKRTMILLAVCLFAGPVSAIELELIPWRYHLGDDETILDWSKLYGPQFETSFMIEEIALLDGTLSFGVWDVDSGFRGIQDRILWDGQIIHVLESTTPENPSRPIVFHDQTAPVWSGLITPGEHTITFTAGRNNTNFELDDYMFQQVWLAYEPGLLGDMNQDHGVNGLDVSPFAYAVINEPFNPRGDMNNDGVMTGLDVAPFVAAVLRGAPARSIPEPGTIILVSIVLMVMIGFRRFA